LIDLLVEYLSSLVRVHLKEYVTISIALHTLQNSVGVILHCKLLFLGFHHIFLMYCAQPVNGLNPLLVQVLPHSLVRQVPTATRLSADLGLEELLSCLGVMYRCVNHRRNRSHCHLTVLR
jgi:hypothetical protein